ncbi:transaldolase [Reticulomyxa filosa]|uniref:transaldolase n=1 Tax=Reticulomyxa filosa TaxID=46433 RepID=X6MLT3_RETFI|nr:transaldolase [Reticulomyxa filosa]|eukprot:ETO14040.1 transaldolase [Reticulomyxa filosa]
MHRRRDRQQNNENTNKIKKAMKLYKPTDATTNPSLVLKALDKLKSDEAKTNAEYDKILNVACDYAKEKCNKKDSDELLGLALDRIAVEFGLRIMQLIPGNISTELDARLSFDPKQSVQRAERIIAMYEELGVKDAKERVLIKVASTWEGFQVCKQLKTKGIRCNMTLLFSIWQAAAAAQIGGAYLISPFVGRITDWYKKEKGVSGFAIKDDPGPKSVEAIYKYYKKFGFKTIVMGASFRNKEQIVALAGCDRLTIAPQFLKELQDSHDSLPRKLDPETAKDCEFQKELDVTEKDAMATEKLAEGIRLFAADTIKLENILKTKLA